jgi:osmotically-inducible protein OsmY
MKRRGSSLMNDSELARSVLDELLWDDSTNASRIKVYADSGKVILTGSVSTFYERWSDRDDAPRVVNVQDVENDIVIDPDAQRVLDDDLVASAQSGLKANRLVPKDAVTVKAQDGWMAMTGDAKHHFQRQAVEQVILHLPELQGFTDRVTVSRNPAENVWIRSSKRWRATPRWTREESAPPIRPTRSL